MSHFPLVIKKASKSRPLYQKTTPQIYDCLKRFTYETSQLQTCPQLLNATNSRTFYSNNYLNISRDSLYFDTRPLDQYISLVFIHICTLLFISCILPPTFFSFSHVFTLHLYISLTQNIFFLSLMMPQIGESLDFPEILTSILQQFYSSLRPQLNFCQFHLKCY